MREQDELKGRLDYLELIAPKAAAELRPWESVDKFRDKCLRLARTAQWKLIGTLDLPDFVPCQPPPGGEIFLGNMLIGERIFKPLLLTLSVFLLGVGVFGASGTGKTTLVLGFILPSLINSGVLTITFDPTGQYSRVLCAQYLPEKVLSIRPERYRVNPLIPPRRVGVEEWKRTLLDIFRFLYVGDVMTNILREGLNYIFSNHSVPTIYHLKAWLDRLKLKSSDYRNIASLHSLRNRVNMLWDVFGEAWTCESGYFDNGNEINRSIIFEMTLDSLMGNFFMDIFVERLRLSQDPFTSALKFVIVYEEAHTRFSVDIRNRETQILERIALSHARVLRKHGVGVVYIDQLAGLMPAQILGNLGTFAIFRLVDEVSIRKVGGAVGLTDLQIDAVRNLPQRRCVVFSHL